MSKPPKGFECRFETGPTIIFLSRENMPSHLFEVRMEYRGIESSQLPTLTCGFSEFVDVGATPESIVKHLLSKLRDISPVVFEPSELGRFRQVAVSWLLFNFRLVPDRG